MKKAKTIKYSMTMNVPETEIRWIICQHCKKRVYGTEIIPKTISPDSYVTEYTWKPERRKK